MADVGLTTPNPETEKMIDDVVRRADFDNMKRLDYESFIAWALFYLAHRYKITWKHAHEIAIVAAVRCYVRRETIAVSPEELADRVHSLSIEDQSAFFQFLISGDRF